MRVSEQTKHNTVQKNLNQNANELQQLQTSMSNGKILNKPSDDPVGAAMVQDYRTSINHAKNIEKNIGSDKVWLDATETAITQMTQTMMKVKTLAMDGGNGGASMEQRAALADEIELLAKDLVNVANSKKGKLFLFSGTKSFTEPLKMNSRIQESETFFMGTRIKSSAKVIPLKQNQPLEGLKPGPLTLTLTPTKEKQAELDALAAAKAEIAKKTLDQETTSPTETEAAAAAETTAKEEKTADTAETAAKETKPGEIPTAPPLPVSNSITIMLTGQESFNEIIEKINKAAIEQEKFTPDPHSPLGFQTRLSAEVGPDNYLYLDPTAGYRLSFGEDLSGFLQKMGFVTLSSGEQVAQNAEGTDQVEETDQVQVTEPLTLPKEIYAAEFKGFSKDTYIVKVVQGGTYGNARYIVSDDGGETWSKIQVLQKQNEIYNPEGKANNKVLLQFGAEGEPFFKEGVEFRFEGNEFVEYKGNDQIKEVPIDNGIKVALNITASELLFKEENDKETVNAFDVLNRLIESLQDDDQEAVLESLNEIETSIHQLLKKQSQVGSTVLELEASEERMASEMDTKAAEISEIEDIDLAKGAVDLNKAELKHKVALDSAARLVQPTLISFLK